MTAPSIAKPVRGSVKLAGGEAARQPTDVRLAAFSRGGDPQSALDLPRFCIDVEESGGGVALEEGIPSEVISALEKMGHPVYSVGGFERSLFGRGQVILREAETGTLVAGSEAAYRERPFITHHYCPVVSPLTFDFDSTEMLIFFTEHGLPSFGTVVPNGGMSSPLTLLGTLAQGNAEFLAWSVLMQMIRPGTPLIYSYLPTIADMRRGSYSPGAIECGMLSMAMTQMAHFYKVPNGGYIGLTNAKVNDAQSGYESGMSTTATLLAGADMFVADISQDELSNMGVERKS